jgi:hypothetical protein
MHPDTVLTQKLARATTGAERRLLEMEAVPAGYALSAAYDAADRLAADRHAAKVRLNDAPIHPKYTTGEPGHNCWVANSGHGNGMGAVTVTGFNLQVESSGAGGPSCPNTGGGAAVSPAAASTSTDPAATYTVDTGGGGRIPAAASASDCATSTTSADIATARPTGRNDHFDRFASTFPTSPAAATAATAPIGTVNRGEKYRAKVGGGDWFSASAPAKVDRSTGDGEDQHHHHHHRRHHHQAANTHTHHAHSQFVTSHRRQYNTGSSTSDPNASTSAPSEATPLNLELEQIRSASLSDRVNQVEGVLRAHHVRDHTAEDLLAERAEVILQLNKRSGRLTASLEQQREEAVRRLRTAEQGCADRVATAETRAQEQIETMRIQARAQVEQAVLAARRADAVQFEREMADSLNQLEARLGAEQRAEVEQLRGEMGRHIAQLEQEHARTTRGLRNTLADHEKRAAEIVDKHRAAARLERNRAVGRAVGRERNRPAPHVPAATSEHQHHPSSASDHGNNQPTPRSGNNNRRPVNTATFATHTATSDVSDGTIRIERRNINVEVEAGVSSKPHQCGACNRQFTTGEAAARCRYTRVSGGCHFDPPGFTGVVGDPGVAQYLRSTMPTELGDSAERIERLNHIAGLERAATRRSDGVVKHRVDALGTQTWVAPPYTQAGATPSSRCTADGVPLLTRQKYPLQEYANPHVGAGRVAKHAMPLSMADDVGTVPL